MSKAHVSLTSIKLLLKINVKIQCVLLFHTNSNKPLGINKFTPPLHNNFGTGTLIRSS